MNFFGHALVASWRSEHPAFALGAMLPDFQTMIGARAQTDHPELSAGIDFHHATDRAFHQIPAFRTLEAEAVARLSAAGLARGPARGAAHVSVELCLDALLIEEPNAVASYLTALALAPSAPLRWSPSSGATHFETLCTRLTSRGVPPPDPSHIATRVTRALSSRPLLSLDSPASVALLRELPSILAATAQVTPLILSTLRSSL